jgi:hypothetical protein
MSGLGNGHRYGSIAKVSSCYVLWRVEVGGRAWRGGARVLIAATWEAGWRGVARCRVGCWIRGATSEEQVSRKGTRGGCPAASLAVCVCVGRGRSRRRGQRAVWRSVKSEAT